MSRMKLNLFTGGSGHRLGVTCMVPSRKRLLQVDKQFRGPSRRVWYENPGTLVPHPYFIEQYCVTGILGRGGTATIYRAFDTTTGSNASKPRQALQEVAIKVGHDGVSERFQRVEGKVLDKTRDTRAPALIGRSDVDVPAGGNKHVLVMEIIDGRTIVEIVEKDGPLSLSKTLRIMTQLCFGARALGKIKDDQGRELVHLDFKPHNFMLTGDGKVKILDYAVGGDERFTGHVPGRQIGTPTFMSPEMTRGEEADRRSDIYSLGVSMYFMLTGDCPFTPEHMGSLSSQGELWMLMLKHRHMPIPELSQHVKLGHTQTLVENLIRKAMAKDSSERYQGYAALIFALYAMRVLHWFERKLTHWAVNWAPLAVAKAANYLAFPKIDKRAYAVRYFLGLSAECDALRDHLGGDQEMASRHAYMCSELAKVAKELGRLDAAANAKYRAGESFVKAGDPRRAALCMSEAASMKGKLGDKAAQASWLDAAAIQYKVAGYDGVAERCIEQRDRVFPGFKVSDTVVDPLF